MISLNKLYTLPRKLRYRKSALILRGFEEGYVSEYDQSYIERLCQRLWEEFQSSGALPPGDSGQDFRRKVNGIRHLLRQITGEDAAEWDLLARPSTDVADLSPPLPLSLYLEDIRSPYNVGALMRTAAAYSLQEVILSPLCPSPDHPRARRSAMGADKLIRWRRLPLSEMDIIDSPRVALELGGESIDQFAFPQDGGILLLGSEELGLSGDALADARRVTIPLRGGKSSLNVAVAGGIAIHQWCATLRTCF